MDLKDVAHLLSGHGSHLFVSDKECSVLVPIEMIGQNVH